MNPTPSDWPRLSSSVFYQDAAAAIDWLCDAFGFTVRLKVEGDNGRIEHSELTFGEGLIMVGQESPDSERLWKRSMRSPKSLHGAGTQSIMFFVDDAQAHCAHARARRTHRRGARDPRLWRGLLERLELRCARSGRPPVVDHPTPAQSTGALMATNLVDHGPAKPILDAAFAALSDSSRREMIRMLLQKPRRAGELADSVDMSPQALSRHLRVLRKAGLVAEEGIEDDARVRVYSVQPAAFQPVQQWLAQVEDLWRGQLQAFKAYAEGNQRGRKSRT